MKNVVKCLCLFLLLTVIGCGDEPCNESLQPAFSIGFYQYDSLSNINKYTIDSLIILNSSFYAPDTLTKIQELMLFPNTNETFITLSVKIDSLIYDSVIIGYRLLWDTVPGIIEDSVYTKPYVNIRFDTVKNETYFAIDSTEILKWQPNDVAWFEETYRFNYRVEHVLVNHECGFRFGISSINVEVQDSSYIKEIITTGLEPGTPTSGANEVFRFVY